MGREADTPEARERALRKAWAAAREQTAQDPGDDLWHWWWRNCGNDANLAELVELARAGWDGSYDVRGILWNWIKSQQVRIESRVGPGV
jgi:hypothetical protein